MLRRPSAASKKWPKLQLRAIIFWYLKNEILFDVRKVFSEQRQIRNYILWEIALLLSFGRALKKYGKVSLGWLIQRGAEAKNYWATNIHLELTRSMKNGSKAKNAECSNSSYFPQCNKTNYVTFRHFFHNPTALQRQECVKKCFWA